MDWGFGGGPLFRLQRIDGGLSRDEEQGDGHLSVPHVLPARRAPNAEDTATCRKLVANTPRARPRSRRSRAPSVASARRCVRPMARPAPKNAPARRGVRRRAPGLRSAGDLAWRQRQVPQEYAIDSRELLDKRCANIKRLGNSIFGVTYNK